MIKCRIHIEGINGGPGDEGRTAFLDLELPFIPRVGDQIWLHQIQLELLRTQVLKNPLLLIGYEEFIYPRIKIDFTEVHNFVLTEAFDNFSFEDASTVSWVVYSFEDNITHIVLKES